MVRLIVRAVAEQWQSWPATLWPEPPPRLRTGRLGLGLQSRSSAATLQHHRDLEPLRDAAQNSELTASTSELAAVHHPGTTAVRQLASRIRHAATPATPATPATTLASRRRGLSRP